jgi:hypothetical protein
LIYVEHRNDEAPCSRVSAAQRLINVVWDDLPGALTFAERHCKAQMPELMRLCEIHMQLESPLFVYAVHFHLDRSHPSYAISKNPDFDWDRVLSDDNGRGDEEVCMKQYEPKDDFWIHVRRLGFQQFELEA